MVAERKTADAAGGKTARACDGCLRKRARWYCNADDAFLCQACDTSVHSANQLAGRHERVRLETASCKSTNSVIVEGLPLAWHQGFTRKARTPRHAKPVSAKQAKYDEKFSNPLALVPEIGSEEALFDENEEQLIYRVPVFDPFASNDEKTETTKGNESKVLIMDYGHNGKDALNDFSGFLPSDKDLEEFAADVESLLGRGLDDDSHDMKGSSPLDCEEGDALDFCFGGRIVKVEEEEAQGFAASCLDAVLDMSGEALDWKFGYELQATGEEEEEEKVAASAEMTTMNGRYRAEKRTKMSLRLNYETVITAWASQGSPWTTGNRPEIDPDGCWADPMCTCPVDGHHPYERNMGGAQGQVGGGDEGREARVSRYREKRRTRLFSKKIRYEVRKLNAEKRPRMKGRFVKRTSFAGPPATFPYLLANNS